MRQIYGVEIITSVYLTEKGEPYEVRRSWKERLFSRPWRPLRATRVIVPQIPYRGAVKLDSWTYIMHPETLAKLGEMCKKDIETLVFGGQRN